MPKKPKKPPQPDKPPPEYEFLSGLPTAGRSDAWVCAVNLLEAHLRGHMILSHPKTTKDRLWSILDEVDTGHTIRSRLDRKSFESTPADRIPELFNLYYAAVITDMMRRATLLEPYEYYELVSFPDAAGRHRRILTSESAHYSRQLPALAPVENEIPSLNTEYLEILHKRLGYSLGRKGVLPAKKKRQPDPETTADVIVDKLGFEELYNETVAASSIYFQAHNAKGGADGASALAKAGSPFLFMWHVLLGHFDMMVDRLLKGMELEFAPKIEPDGKSSPTARSPKAGISRGMIKRDKNT
jgi:hypothetical protein